ncbi:MAG: class I SAM-dependent methyltransferase [Candidatus Scalindua sp.]
MIVRFLPKQRSTVIDVGGAFGIYSFYVAELGHDVHLVDIVPKHIEQAKIKSLDKDAPQLSSMGVGDARNLDFPDNFAHVMISHEPMYHLTERSERLKAIAETKCVLLPGGVLLAFAINRYAGIVYGISKGYIYDTEYMKMTNVEVETGLRNDAPRWLNTFSSAFFHLPKELEDELVEAGMIFDTLLGIVGPSWLVPDIDTDWSDPEKRKVLIETARMLEHEPLLGPRILGIARKPK